MATPAAAADNIGHQLRQFLAGAARLSRGGEPDARVVSLALQLLSQVPAARGACLEHLSAVFEHATADFFRRLKPSLSGVGDARPSPSPPLAAPSSSTAPEPTCAEASSTSLVASATQFLSRLIDQADWTLVLAQWSLQLLGHLSSRFHSAAVSAAQASGRGHDRRGGHVSSFLPAQSASSSSISSTSELSACVRRWSECEATRCLLTLAVQCVQRNTPACVRPLLDTSVQCAPHFDWVVARVGACFPRKLALHLLSVGVSEFDAQCGAAAAAASSKPGKALLPDPEGESDAVKLRSITQLLDHLSSAHADETNAAIADTLQEALVGGDGRHTAIVPFLMRLAELSPRVWSSLCRVGLPSVDDSQLSILCEQRAHWVARHFADQQTLLTHAVRLLLLHSGGAGLLDQHTDVDSVYILTRLVRLSSDEERGTQRAPPVQRAATILLDRVVCELESVACTGRVSACLSAASHMLPCMTAGKHTASHHWQQNLSLAVPRWTPALVRLLARLLPSSGRGSAAQQMTCVRVVRLLAASASLAGRARVVSVLSQLLRLTRRTADSSAVVTTDETTATEANAACIDQSDAKLPLPPSDALETVADSSAECDYDCADSDVGLEADTVDIDADELGFDAESVDSDPGADDDRTSLAGGLLVHFLLSVVPHTAVTGADGGDGQVVDAAGNDVLSAALLAALADCRGRRDIARVLLTFECILRWMQQQKWSGNDGTCCGFGEVDAAPMCVAALVSLAVRTAANRRVMTCVSRQLTHGDARVVTSAVRLLACLTLTPGIAPPGGCVILTDRLVAWLLRQIRLLEVNDEHDVVDSGAVTRIYDARAQLMRVTAAHPSVCVPAALRRLLQAALDACWLCPSDNGQRRRQRLTDQRRVLLESNSRRVDSLGVPLLRSSIFHAGSVGQPSRAAGDGQTSLSASQRPYPGDETSKRCQLLLDVVEGVVECGGGNGGVAEAARTLALLLVEVVSPDVMYNGLPWPDEEFTKVTIERDLAIRSRFETCQLLWPLLELLAQLPPALCYCSVLLRALVATLLHHWVAVQDRVSGGAAGGAVVATTVRLIRVMCVGRLLPPPFTLLPDVIPHVSAYEVYLLLGDVWSYMRETVPSPALFQQPQQQACDGHAAGNICMRQWRVFDTPLDRRWCVTLLLVMQNNIARLGHLFGQLRRLLPPPDNTDEARACVEPCA